MVPMFTPPPVKKVTALEATLAARVLRIEFLDGLTAAMVRSAFRATMRNYHPDLHTAAGSVDVDVAEKLAIAQDARNTLDLWLQQGPYEKCSTCRGSGTVPSGNPFQKRKPCPSCQR